jgi:hypothetical protein
MTVKNEYFRQENGIDVVMDRFIGVKIVHGIGMTDRQFYGDYKKQPIDASKPEQKGFMVRYDNGYESWCPWDHFWAANRPTSAMPFGHALEAAKKGLKIARYGWNGKGMFVFLREGRQITNVDPNSPMGGDFESRPHLCMKVADGKCVVGWLASQTDMLSDDWMIVD